MPRFWRRFCGPRVTTSPQVINGAASPGQHVWIGRLPRSTSAPSRTSSWHGAADTTVGTMLSTCFKSGSLSQRSRHPRGGSGSLSNASRRPISRSSCTSLFPMPRATRNGVPNKLASTGIRNPAGRSNKSAGPPRLSTRSQISVISRRGAISTATRFSSPGCSGWAMKSRRSRYFIGASACDRRGGKQRNAPPEFRDNSRPHRRADEIIEHERAEAAFAPALAYEQVLVRNYASRDDETGKISHAAARRHAHVRHAEEKQSMANHYARDIETSEQNRRGLESELDVVVAIDHRVLRIVRNRPKYVGEQQHPRERNNVVLVRGKRHRDTEAERDAEPRLRHPEHAFQERINHRERERNTG